MTRYFVDESVDGCLCNINDLSSTLQIYYVRGLFQGLIDLRVWPGVEGSEDTPGKASDKGKEQMQRLAKLAKKHRNGHVSKVNQICFFYF